MRAGSSAGGLARAVPLAVGAAATAAAAAGRVLLDVGADDLEATGLVLPGVRVVGTRVDGCASVVVVVVERCPPTGPGVCPRRRSCRAAGAGSAGWATVCVVVGVASSRGLQPVPHARRAGRERRGRVRGAPASSSEPASQPAARAVVAAVPGGQGVVRVVAGAVGPPLGLDERTGLVGRGRGARRRAGAAGRPVGAGEAGAGRSEPQLGGS